MMPPVPTAPTTDLNTCEAFLSEQGRAERARRAKRSAFAARLGISEDRLDALLTESVARPDKQWNLA